MSYVINKFKPIFDQAISNIEHFLSLDNELGRFTKWILETEINYHSFLPCNIAETISSAEGMSGFLSMLYHSLYDDGSICFPVINSYPKISFLDEKEFSLDKELPHYCEFNINQTDIKFISSLDEFMEECYKAEVAIIKRAFITDVRIYSNEKLDWLVSHYKKYSFFDQSWIDEAVTIKNKK